MKYSGYRLIEFREDFEESERNCCECEGPFYTPQYQKIIENQGLSCFWYKNVIFQIVECLYPDCGGLFVVKSTVNKPILDMSGMIMVPHIHAPINIFEQIKFLESHASWPESLKFCFNKAWDDNYLSIEDVKSSHLIWDTNFYRYLFNLESEKQIYEILKEERQSTESVLRKFIPKTKLNQALIDVIAPKQETSLELVPYPPDPEKQFEEKMASFLYLLQHYSGISIHDAIKKKLNDYGIKEIENLDIEIYQAAYTKLHTTKNDLHLVHDCILRNDFAGVEKKFKEYFNEILHTICTKHFLSEHRENLSGWIKETDEKTALFVDAPMGLGKTHSIIEGLANNSEKSAVIFMPTKRLCQDFRNEMAYKLSIVNEMLPTLEEIIPFERIRHCFF